MKHSEVFDKGQELINYVGNNSSTLPKELVELVYSYFNLLNEYNSQSYQENNQAIELLHQEIEASKRKKLLGDNPSFDNRGNCQNEWSYPRLESLIYDQAFSSEKSPGVIPLLHIGEIEENNAKYYVKYRGLVHDCYTLPWIEFTEVSITISAEVDVDDYVRQLKKRNLSNNLREDINTKLLPDFESLEIDFEEINKFYEHKIIENQISMLHKEFIIKLNLKKDD